jgi:hypothetical protein
MILIILAILLTACGAAPQYGALATLTSAPNVTPASAPTVTSTSASTVIPTQLPSAQDAAVKFHTTFYTRDYTEKFDVYQARVCALATEAGCQALSSTLKNIRDNDPKYKVKTGVEISNPILLGSGVLPSGKIWQAWQVAAKYTKPWAGLRSNDLHPAGFYTWVDGGWKYDGQTNQAAVDLLLKAAPAPTEAK